MYQMSTAFREAKNRGDRPIVQAIVTGSTKRWIFGVESPSLLELGDLAPALWDGSRSVGDGTFFNQVATADWGARVISFGRLTHGLTAGGENLFIGMSETRISSIQTVYDNRDHYFSALFSIASGISWLNMSYDLCVGFPGLTYNEFQRIFSGKITEIILTDNTMTAISESI